MEKLRAWEDMGYGMFIHFGMSTFGGPEAAKGKCKSTVYGPDKLDVDQWICTARDAGMSYAVLTTKHHSGHCLWPSEYTDYHVGTSGCKTDVVYEFVKACEKYKIMPGFYYDVLDNFHKFDSLTWAELDPHNENKPDNVKNMNAYVGEQYMEFMCRQLEELLTQYGEIGEIFIDIPRLLPAFFRRKLYNYIADIQPEAVIAMNHGIRDGSVLDVESVWPTDIITIEKCLPPETGHEPWRRVYGEDFYLPAEVCDTVGLGPTWFYSEDKEPKTDEDLLGMYLMTRARGANLLLNVGPDRHGRIPEPFVNALIHLEKI
jgi:alpha-L-fucosidase